MFELRGVIIPEGGIAVDRGQVTIQLQALSGSLAGKDRIEYSGPGGKFRYKKIPTGTYLLTAFVPRVGRSRRTVEIGPSLADKQGKIEVSIRLAARRRRPGLFEVQAHELSLPPAARDEYEKGLQQLLNRNLAQAAECFRRATERAPQYFAAWYQLGSIASSRQLAREAADYYREALKIQPDNFRALIALGEALLASSDGPAAVAVNEQAVKIRPDDSQAQVQLGFSLMLAGRPEQAEAHLKEAIALDPAHYMYPQLMLAEIYRRRNDLPALRRELEEFLRLHPDSPKAGEVRPLLGEILLHMKN